MNGKLSTEENIETFLEEVPSGFKLVFRSAFNSGHKVACISAIREIRGIGLTEAVALFDTLKGL